VNGEIACKFTTKVEQIAAQIRTALQSTHRCKSTVNKSNKSVQWSVSNNYIKQRSRAQTWLFGELNTSTSSSDGLPKSISTRCVSGERDRKRERERSELQISPAKKLDRRSFKKLDRWREGFSGAGLWHPREKENAG
jgi:hypothetical protein